MQKDKPTFLLIFLLLLWVGCDGPRTPKVGEKAPDLLVYDLAGKPHRLADYRGKLVMLHFWTDWCDACRKEFPKIQDYYQRLKADDFEILAVNVGQPKSVSSSFQAEFGVTFPMMVDENRETVDIYNIRAYPTNYLINGEGTIVRRIVGWVDEQQVGSLLHNIRQNQQP